MLGAMADMLTSVAMPNQQWVSGGSVCVFTRLLYASTNATNSRRELQTHMEGIFQGSTSSLSLAHVVMYQVYFRSSL